MSKKRKSVRELVKLGSFVPHPRASKEYIVRDCARLHVEVRALCEYIRDESVRVPNTTIRKLVEQVLDDERMDALPTKRDNSTTHLRVCRHKYESVEQLRKVVIDAAMDCLESSSK